MTTNARSLLLIALALGGCGAPAERLPSDLPPIEAPPTSTLDDWEVVPTATSERFQAQLDRAVDDLGLHGAALAAVRLPTHDLWAGASGSSDRAQQTPWAPERQFRIGSVTKTFTAAIILQLVDEGAIGLDDLLEDWAPGYYDGLGITVRHLISNSSGIVSYNYVGSFDDSRRWSPSELVEWAVTHEAELRFAPGSEWEYSNTNFVLLGLVIEAATGQTFEDVVQARLLDPIGLEDTYVAGSGDDNSRLVPCYDEGGNDITGVSDPSFGWAAGSIVSTPRDLARWAAALYGGDVLSTEMLDMMITPTHGTVDEILYGMGAFIESDDTNAIYGHTGGIGGYQTYMYYARNEQAAVVVMSSLRGTNLRELSAYGWSVVMDFEYP